MWHQKISPSRRRRSRSSEYSDGYWKSNPKERERLMSALDRGLTKIRARFNARPDLNTADRIAKVARAFRQEQAGIYGSKPPASLTTDVLAHNEEFQKLLEDGYSDQTHFQLPLMSIGADVDSDKFWNRMAEKLTNNLTPEMRVMIADRNAQLSRVAFRIERFDKQFRNFNIGSLRESIQYGVPCLCWQLNRNLIHLPSPRCARPVEIDAGRADEPPAPVLLCRQRR